MPPTSRARIDLHTHSRFSDGTCTIDELLAHAHEAGLDAIALTDHDTVAGWDEAREAADRYGVDVIPGIEVSTEHGCESVHVLALLPDRSEGTALAAEIRRARDSRMTRAQRMVERIAEDHPISWEGVLGHVAGEDTTVGRPHIADALVAAGVVPDRSAAFAELLAPSGPYYVRHYAPDPCRAVTAIREAGGVPILAHPGSSARDSTVDEELMEAMVDAGLLGIEVDHREHDDEARRRLASFARSHALLVTGGSDYHGAGKPNRLGENLTRPDVLEAMISLSTSDTEVYRA